MAEVYGPPHPVDGGNYAPIFTADSGDVVLVVRAVNCHKALMALAKEVAREDLLGVHRIKRQRKMAKEALALARKTLKA